MTGWFKVWRHYDEANKLQKLEDALIKHMLNAADLADRGDMGDRGNMVVRGDRGYWGDIFDRG